MKFFAQDLKSVKALNLTVFRLLKCVDNRGLYTFFRLFRHILFFGKTSIPLNLNLNQSLISIPVDPYWLRLLSRSFQYEPEIKQVLNSIRQEFCFIDFGANIGYWSNYVSKLESCTKIIAVEPNITLSKFLAQNLDHNKTTLVAKAISSKSTDDSFLFLPGKENLESDATLIKGLRGVRKLPISTISFQDFMTENPFPPSILVFKVDVEGVEPLIIKGILGLKYRRIVIIYEEHGKQDWNTSTYFLLKKNYSIFYFQRKWIKIQSIRDLQNIKKDSRKAYNLVATNMEEISLDS
jgi:FkbM family methyltransferase